MYKMKGFVSALASTSSIVNRSVINQTKMTGGFVVKAEDMESEENMMSLYERWMEYQEIYRHDEEKHRRFPVFQERVKRFRSANCFEDSFKYELKKRLIKHWDCRLKRHQLSLENEVILDV
ncbi:hypothetical protein MKW98_031887 [Papaver atlanticum]|uniref:Cathepsin propeptide inhibitor domain-containing protein n=1 Tax=Papaver atlanticum TaxID=357466 RepID=A0AAD4SE53_9MAGN|nr:hypothetical protein MKW98_031887 [Papaver atlanticum]